MKLATKVRIFANMLSTLLILNVAVVAQSVGPEALGIVPTGSFQSHKIDTINIGNKNGVIRIPLFSLPQLGNLTLSYSAYANTTTWHASSQCSSQQVTCTYSYYTNAIPYGTSSIYSVQLGPYIADDDSYSVGLNTPIAYMGNIAYYGQKYFLIDSSQAQHSLWFDSTNTNYLRSTDGSKLLYVKASSTVTDISGTLIDSNGTQHTGYAFLNRADVSNNTITYNANSGATTDSIGRVVPPLPGYSQGAAGCPDLSSQASYQPATKSAQWVVPGQYGNVTYLFCYADISVHTNFWNHSGQSFVSHDPPPGNCGDPGEPACNFTQLYEEFNNLVTVLQSIVLPDKSYWAFTYDAADPNNSNAIAYGTLSKIIFPTGGSVSYTYQMDQECMWTYADGPAPSEVGAWWSTLHLSQRTEADNNGHTYVWDYDNQTDPNGNQTTYVFDGGPPLPGPCITPGLESHRQIYQGSGASKRLLKSIDTTYQYVLEPGSNSSNGALGLGSITSQQTTTTTDNLAASTVLNNTGYDSKFQGVAIDCVDADPNQCGPFAPVTMAVQLPKSESVLNGSGETIKLVKTSYRWEDTSSPGYWNSNLLNTPVSISTLDGGSSVAAKTTMSYDESAYSSCGTCGHLTTTDRMNNMGNDVQTHTAWTSTGMVDHVVDGNGVESAQYAYDSQYSGLFPTTIANAAGQQTTYKYDLNTGKITSKTDPNSQTMSYTYDSVSRLVDVSTPDVLAGTSIHGETKYCYNIPSASGGQITSPAGCSNGTANAVVMSETQSASSQIVQEADIDGLGRIIETKVLSDPSGTVLTDYGYDGLDQLVSVSNSYRGTPPGIATLFTFDALGRKIIQTQPDQSQIHWCYNGSGNSNQRNCTSNQSSLADSVQWVDYTDETGRHWQRGSDLLGRLREVIEPDPATGNLSLKTDYFYNVLGDLTNVTQIGAAGEASRNRSFSYDSLSRLIISSNGETGTICYGTWSGTNCLPGYDGNGNLHYRTDARGVTTSYGYDVLNRMTSKTYQGNSVQTPSSCYQYDSGASGAGNFVGRLTHEWTTMGSCTTTLPQNGVLTRRSILDYDAMGRIKQEQQCHGNTCTTGIPYNSASGYDLAGNLTSFWSNVHSIGLGQSYDSAGRLVSIGSTLADQTHPATLFSVGSYTPFNVIQTMTLGTNINVTRGYDNRLRPTSEGATHP